VNLPGLDSGGEGLFIGCGEEQMEGGSLALLGFDVDASAVAADNGVTGCQPEAVALSLCCKERVRFEDRFASFCEREQLLCKVACPFDCLEGFFKILADGVADGWFACQIDISVDSPEKIVEGMSDAACKDAQGLKLLRVLERLLGLRAAVVGEWRHAERRESTAEFRLMHAVLS